MSRTTFTDEQFANPYPDGIQHHYWHRARNRVIVRRIGAHFTPRARDAVLDIGCGRGITVAHLRRIGWNAVGCDLGRPTPITPEIGAHLFVETDAFRLPAALTPSVRCILMLDVLEHLEDPRAFLGTCLDTFPACEFVFVTLPARTEIWSNYDEYYGHFHRYSRPSARALFERPEFQVLGSGYFFHLLYPPALILRWLHVQRQTVIKAPGSGGGPHALLTGYFDVEERLAPSWLPGTSVYVAARVRRDPRSFSDRSLDDGQS